MSRARCPKVGCTAPVHAGKLACAPHWYMVSPGIRSALLTAWRTDDPEYWDLRQEAIKEMNDGAASHNG